MKLKTLLVALIALAVVGLWAGFSAADAPEAPGDQKTKALDFTLKDINGKEVSLKDYRGKVVLINVWATWCGPCVHEIPDLVKLHQRYKDQNFEVLGIYVQSNEAQVKKMVQHFKMEYPVLAATPDALAKLPSINAIPRTFVLDTSGRIVEDVTGMQNLEKFEQLILKHLKKVEG